MLLIRKSGNLLELSDSISKDLPLPYRQLLEPYLCYNYKKFYFGREQRLHKQKVALIPTQLYRYDRLGRLICGAGLLVRITTLLTEHKIAYTFTDLSKLNQLTVDKSLATSKLSFRHPEQERCLEAILNSPCGIIYAPTAFGKMVMLTMTCLAFPGATIDIVTRRIRLVNKLVEFLSNYLPDIGQVDGSHKHKRRITVYSAGSLQHADYKSEILIGEECFPAGTLVDGKPIEKIQVGDLVWSVDVNGLLEQKPVLRKYVNKCPNVLYTIRLSNGNKLVCTSNHPIWTINGFKPAKLVTIGDIVYDLSKGFNYVQTKTRQKTKNLCHVWFGMFCSFVSRQYGNLFRRVLAYKESHGGTKNSREYTKVKFSAQRGNFVAYAIKQSDEICGGPGQGIGHYEEDGSQTDSIGRQRPWFNTPRNKIGGGNWFTHLLLCLNTYACYFWLSNPLQNRFNGSSLKIGGRNRWSISQYISQETERQEKATISGRAWVDSIEIYQQNGGQQFRRMCPDNKVYNLEVADNHTYFANGILVHNCHQLLASDAAQYLVQYRNSRNYGFTASPRGRADGADSRLESLFGPVIYYLSYAQAVTLGLVCPIQVQWTPVHGDNPCPDGCDTIVRKRTGIWRHEQRNLIIANKARTFTNQEQVLITVETIEHGLHLKQLLPEFTLVYDSVQSQDLAYYKKYQLWPDNLPLLTNHDKEQLRQQFEQGTLKKAIATGVWHVGIDPVQLTAVLRAEGSASEIMDIQIPGRVARISQATNKQAGLIFDFGDQFDKVLRQKARQRSIHYQAMGWEQVQDG